MMNYGGGGGEMRFNIFAEPFPGGDGGKGVFEEFSSRWAWWEMGGQLLDGDSGFLEIAVINFTSRLLFDFVSLIIFHLCF